jgi:hypothetical protein
MQEAARTGPSRRSAFHRGFNLPDCRIPPSGLTGIGAVGLTDGQPA